MRLSALRGVLAVALMVAAVAAGLASTHDGASAQAPATDTITTELRPGWNLVGWMGPDTTPADLFRNVRGLQVVAAWDADAGRYAWVRRGGTAAPALEQVSRGQGLFLWLSGTRAVQWTRPASVEGMLLTLPPGESMVGWAGLDGTPIAEAVGRFGDALVGASRWNAETQSYERYEPGSDEPADGSPLLNHGDALWVELSEERRWWQSGTARTRFVFGKRVADEKKSELRDEMEQVVAYFAERYGIEPPEFMVNVVPELPNANASLRLIRLGDLIENQSYLPFALAHEYFHILQFDWAPGSLNRAAPPLWLVEGTARFAEDLYGRGRQGEADDRLRTAWWRQSLSVGVPLRTLESWDRFRNVGGPAYELGAFATDWLVRRTAAVSASVPFDAYAPDGLIAGPEWDAHMEYYRLLRSAFSWQAAFKDAFGISVADFYAAFEEYREAFGTARLPHLADDENAPIIVIEGEIPAGAAARIRAEFEDVLALFRDRFAGEPADYTVFAAADAASAEAAHLRVTGLEIEQAFCGRWTSEDFVVDLSCYAHSVTPLARHHVAHVMDRLAPDESLPSLSEEFCSRGPCWLTTATSRYVEAVSREAVDVETLAQTRGRSIASARGSGEPLPALETSAGIEALESRAADALSFLAADWLVARAGERSLFEYYRLLPSSVGWEAAFEAAFDITIDDFYDAFAEHRAAGFPS